MATLRHSGGSATVTDLTAVTRTENLLRPVVRVILGIGTLMR